MQEGERERERGAERKRESYFSDGSLLQTVDFIKGGGGGYSVIKKRVPTKIGGLTK